MIESGEAAPSFTLPAVRDGEIVELALDEFLGSEIIILAFYPGDFNPSCEGSETGLDELDLFTMQKDVTVLAISGDSVHSHRAFADQYNLHMPLLSDTDGSVARAYGVAVDDEMTGHLTKRAVVVIDHTETVQYTWESPDPAAVPSADEIRRAIEGIADDQTAESRYRVGHAHYMEGRRAFTSAMKAYEGEEWMMAQTDFTRAAEEFDEAGDEFDTAARFAESEETGKYFDRAEQKSESLWRAADWLAESASAYASGRGAKGQTLRSDAEAPLETARDLHEPPAPDEFPPEEDPAETDDDERVHPLAEDDEPAASLDADIDEAATEGDSEQSASESAAQGTGTDPPTREAGDTESTATPNEDETHTSEQGRKASPDSEGMTQPRAETAHNEEATAGEEIDDEELEEITAELEEQTEAAELSDPEPGGGNVVPDEIESNGNEGTEQDDDTDDVELELTDPTDGEDEDEDEEVDANESITDDSGDHGVPDSL